MTQGMLVSFEYFVVVFFYFMCLYNIQFLTLWYSIFFSRTCRDWKNRNNERFVQSLGAAVHRVQLQRWIGCRRHVKILQGIGGRGGLGLFWWIQSHSHWSLECDCTTSGFDSSGHCQVISPTTIIDCCSPVQLFFTIITHHHYSIAQHQLLTTITTKLMQSAPALQSQPWPLP